MKITANAITITRMILVPFPCAWLAQGDFMQRWIAFFLLILLAMTDFVDGWLARCQGPTKLGALLDPVADKIFTAGVALAFTVMGAFHAAVVAVMLGREFFLTAFRSMLLQRGQRLQVSTLAKLKTIFQMGGFGTIFVTLFAPQPWHAQLPATVGLLFAAAWAYRKLNHQNAPTWVLPVAAAFAYVALANSLLPPAVSVDTQTAIIVFMTLASALVYLHRGWRLLWPAVHVSDAARCLWSISYPVCAAYWVTVNPQLLLPLIFWLGFELVHGGIDNVVSANNRHVTTTYLAYSTLLLLLFWLTATTAWLPATQWPPAAIWLMVGMSGLLCAKAAWKNKQMLISSAT
ncbi:MAG: CDP-alcohol phosphatidyltransferase family protein [Myxococcota bacterium]